MLARTSHMIVGTELNDTCSRCWTVARRNRSDVKNDAIGEDEDEDKLEEAAAEEEKEEE